MKKISILTILLLLINILPSCSVSTQNTFSNSKLEDLNYFCENLEKNHKNLYANISKETFIAEKQKITEKINDMSDSDFYFSLKHLLSLVGDAHTSLYFSDSKYKHLNALCFAVAKYGDNWYLMMLEEGNEQYLGCKLLRINDMDINEIFERSKSIISYENNAWAEYCFSNTINFKESLEYLNIVEKGEIIKLQIEDCNGNIKNLKIKSMNEQEVLSAKIVSVIQKNTPKTTPRGIYSSMQLDNNSYYIQYNSCRETPDLSMKDFVSIVRDQINKNSYKKIIIDLRYNLGGSSPIFEPMISELSKLQNDKHFKVYTIIGKNTFSSAIINAIQTKDQLNSILVGTPTGGNVNGYGEIESFTLRNTPITVGYSTKYFELIYEYEKDSLYPDIYVEQNFEDYLNGVDREVDIILNIED